MTLELYHPSQSRSQRDAACAVLSAVLDIAPPVGDELEDLARSIGEPERALDPRPMNRLMDGAVAWCRRHYLHSPLLVFTTMATVEYWTKGGHRPQVAPVPVFEVHLTADPPPAFDPSRHTRAAYSQIIEEYMAEVEAEWIQRQVLAGERPRRRVEKRGQFGAGADQHYRWFAMHQVLDQSPRRIAASVERQPSTVAQGIKSVSELVKVPRRPRRGGRPRTRSI